ncbi:MAG: hypothetical protein U9R14_04345 [Patescibacteria group bacterium]|nr:hypothetical protein [Patescibacteria group bacterium]
MKFKEVFKNNFVPVLEFNYYVVDFDVKIIDGKEYKHRFVTHYVFNSIKHFEENQKEWRGVKVEELYYSGITDEIPTFWDLHKFESGSLYKKDGRTYSQNYYTQLLCVAVAAMGGNTQNFGLTGSSDEIRIFNDQISLNAYYLGKGNHTFLALKLSDFPRLYKRFDPELKENHIQYLKQRRESIYYGSRKRIDNIKLRIIENLIYEKSEIELVNLCVLYFEEQISEKEELNLMLTKNYKL